MPFPPSTLHLLPHLDFGPGHPEAHQAFGCVLRGAGFPLPLLNNDLYRLESSFSLFIVAVAHTYQTVAVLGKQLLSPAVVRP